MKVLVAIDSMKGSLSSLDAGYAAQKGILQAIPEAKVMVRPLADGGEGTVDALVQAMNGEFQELTVTGPLGESVTCTYGILPESRTAVLEMAAAAGITLVPEEKRNPLHTTTYGVGEIIRDAIEKGCRRFLVGIGGSATNDGGIGMLQALGYEFLDKEGKQVPFGALGLGALQSISDEKKMPELDECEFRVACDVKNPLYGSEGCSAVFGPQKGATPYMIAVMDGWMSRYAKLAGEYKQTAVHKEKTDGLIMRQDLTVNGENHDPEVNQANTESYDWAEYPGTGAAGGLGFAFRTFLNASLESGIGIVLEETGLEQYVKAADIVVTGEGRLDGQSAMGKAPIGLAALAKKYQKPVLAFAGSVTADAGVCNSCGIDAFFPIVRGVTTLEEAMKKENAAANLSAAAEQAFRLVGAIWKQ